MYIGYCKLTSITEGYHDISSPTHRDKVINSAIKMEHPVSPMVSNCLFIGVSRRFGGSCTFVNLDPSFYSGWISLPYRYILWHGVHVFFKRLNTTVVVVAVDYRILAISSNRKASQSLNKSSVHISVMVSLSRCCFAEKFSHHILYFSTSSPTWSESWYSSPTMSTKDLTPEQLHDDHSYLTTIAIGFGIALPVVAVVLRLYARKINNLRLGPDDYMIIVAAVCILLPKLMVDLLTFLDTDCGKLMRTYTR